MKHSLAILFFLLLAVYAKGQKTAKDTSAEKEGIAVAEFGGAATGNIKGGPAAFGYSIAVEATPIENWLELELGFTPTYNRLGTDKEVGLLFKKPWTLSPKAEFMFGLGLAWDHSVNNSVAGNSLGGEVALDFMFWPSGKHLFGWYVEPAYGYSFNAGHEQSLSASAGLLVSIP